MFINIAFSIVIWYVIIVAIIKFLPVIGINPKDKIKPICVDKGVEVNKKTMAKVFGLSLLLRIVLYIISLFSIVLILSPEKITFECFLNAWDKWDATRYLAIAENGYGAFFAEETDYYNLAFFPLYPWTVRIFTNFIPNIKLAGLIVSTLYFSAAMAFMYALVANDYGKKVAKLSVIFISIAPFSFFLGGIMSESTFLFTTVLAWYLIKKEKWFWAAIVGALASMSRIVGILIVIPYVLELIEANAESFRNHKYKEWFIKCFKQGFWVFLIPLGLAVYLVLNYHYTGDCFKFLEYQHTYWYHSFCYFGKGMQNYWNEVLTNGRTLNLKFEMFIPQAVSYTFSALLMFLCCRNHRSLYTLYYVAYFIVVTSDTWQTSGARFMVVAIPLYIMLANLVKKRDLLALSLIIISTALYGIYSTMYLAGKFIY